MLSDRDYFILRVLDKVTLANINQLMILCGYRDPSVIRKRLKPLIEDLGLIKSDWLGTHLVYTLSQNGIYELEKSRKPYEIHGFKSKHEEYVASAACMIYAKMGRGINEMVFDREMNSLATFKGVEHKPDIVVSPHIAVEVELTAKANHRIGSGGLQDNFVSDLNNYERTIWILPSSKPGMRERLQNLEQKYHCGDNKVSIITLDTMERMISKMDLKENVPRMWQAKVSPGPVVQTQTESEVQFDE